MPAVRRKPLAWALCVVLAAGLLFSAWFLAQEVRHTCTGAHCPVCACLQAAARQLHGGARPSARSAGALTRFRRVEAPGQAVMARPGSTLVDRKIRLDN